MTTFDLNTFQPGQSMYIQASAGTGKTYTIKEIVGKLILQGVGIDKLLIVTYTEKAAGELRDRIREKLNEMLNNAKSSQEQELLNKALSDLVNATIGTIHSFCQKTLEEYSFIAHKPQSLTLVDEGGIEDFVEKWLRDEMVNDKAYNYIETQAKSWGITIDKYGLVDKVKNGIVEGIKKYFLDKDWNENKDVITLDDKYVEASFGRRNNKQTQLFTYDDCEEDAKKDTGDYFKAKSKRDGSINNSWEERIKNFVCAKYIKLTIPTLYQKWIEYKSERKQQTYNDMIRNVHEAVCEDKSALLTALQNKYCYAIIDEFQDTNQLQWNIFKRVFLNVEGHTIIVVGDPKQSIYSFQGADVHVYQKAIAEIKQGYVLSTNYRSTDDMVGACNELFKKKDFFDNDFVESIPSKTINPTKFDGEDTEPFWIALGENSENSEEIEEGEEDAANEPNAQRPIGVSTEDFAAIAVEKIAECCTNDNNGKTRLQIYDKDRKNYRDVTFKDFAILARTTSEMVVFENALAEVGIPYSRYKDKNLFKGTECSNWIALLNAVDATDFIGRNRKYLNKALCSKFFEIPFENIEDTKYDDPSNRERQIIVELHEIAQERHWAKMVEHIFEQTQVESRLSSVDKLQSLGKYRQLGNYIVDYLYSNNCSLDVLIKHLKTMADNGGDEALVEISTDFDCVQIMTIHASKGLEFPVVIMGGGFIGYSDKMWGNVNVIHSGNDVKLSVSKDYGLTIYKEEIQEEWKRIYYVALTRASSLMILPKYQKWAKDFGGFLENSINDFVNNNKGCYKEIGLDEDDVDQLIKAILLKDSVASDIEQQKGAILDLAENVRSKRARQHSYSSLTHHKKKNTNKGEETNEDKPVDEEEQMTEVLNDDNTRYDKEEDDSVKMEITDTEKKGEVFYQYVGTEVNPADIIPETYPKGANLGSALHEVFQFADFKLFGKLDKSDDDEKLKDLIIKSFRNYAFVIDENDEKKKGWIEQSVKIVKNTLNAKFPVIKGSEISDTEPFQLKVLAAADMRAEAEFNLRADEPNLSWIHHCCTGFIDLMFVRKNGDKDVYSILDWKSDSIEPEIYGNAEEIKKVVDERYYIQRVLYSYCLIKWLKQFPEYKGMECNDIFNDHFGGVYYVFLRATKVDSFNGTYSHTWKSWDCLEAAFNAIRDKNMKPVENMTD